MLNSFLAGRTEIEVLTLQTLVSQLVASTPEVYVGLSSFQGANGGSSTILTKGVVGGWLKALVETTFEVYSSSSSSSSSLSNNTEKSTRNDDKSPYALKNSYLDTVTSSTQRLLKYFIPTTSLLLDLLNKSQSRFELKIAMLPSKLQMYLNEHPAVVAFNSSNLDQLCHHLLLYPLHSTLQVR